MFVRQFITEDTNEYDLPMGEEIMKVAENGSRVVGEIVFGEYGTYRVEDADGLLWPIIVGDYLLLRR